MTLAHREEGPAEGPVALLLHGYPESSYQWRHLMPAIAEQGWRAVAPDLAGFGDSPPDPPGTWERHVESIRRFHEEQELGEVVLVAHDWGGLIGLAWACDHPGAVRGLVISATGFFADGKWHGLGQVMRTEGQGEELMRSLDRDGFAAMLGQTSSAFDDEALDEYWRAYDGEERRRTHLDFYRSMDFEKLARYDGRLAALGVPALILWGENDAFAPVAGAHRFDRELPDSELVVIEGAGHFVFEDAPEETTEAVTSFLAGLSS
ncbi:MAG TPA: alpha/beta fold hydrolase [Thermoleophilaceae bacterium]|nr:alpha/beta fold hydrolase [Thermoleophilaceae bacterium]